MINIKIQKKDLWLLAAIFVFLVGVGYVIAWGSGQPSVHGHDAGEIEGAGFGDWVDVTAQASDGSVQGPVVTDGFVLATILHNAGSDGGTHRIEGYTDKNLNPSTLVIAHASSSQNTNPRTSITMPVKKGHYWRISKSGRVDSQFIYWIPFD